MTAFELRAIGRVVSPLLARGDAPRQADEGAPEAVLVFTDDVVAGLRTLRPGEEVIVLTWLHEAARDVLEVHPRGDLDRPREGVFNTRSPDRPNPIGLHRVTIRSVAGPRVEVSGLEAIDGTPIVDLKPVLGDRTER